MLNNDNNRNLEIGMFFIWGIFLSTDDAMRRSSVRSSIVSQLKIQNMLTSYVYGKWFLLPLVFATKIYIRMYSRIVDDRRVGTHFFFYKYYSLNKSKILMFELQRVCFLNKIN